MKKLIALSTVVTALSTPAALAQDFDQASAILCDKIKVCAIETIKKERGDSAINDAIRAMMYQQLDQACARLKQDFQTAEAVSGGLQKAAACMVSLTQKTCSDLNAMGDDPQTAECTELQKVAGK